ncbi:amidohydrolase [Wohlfahrtiimonas larvae]|uniref:Amidohydrolase n=1 Tax=Wohlfahrtiimonas larvae TaxID=1157986 RepID=A0ABP9MY33_9GAMM|nr:amidohydrolase [Wohlfahrtiimonas larvae]
MVKADAIYFNGNIYSADAHNTFYTAMAITQGEIIAMGDDTSILRHQDEATKLVDLHGQFVMPGLVDSHLHPFWGASQSLSCNLKHQVLSKSEILVKITEYAERYMEEHKDGWIIVRGWMQPDMLPIGSELVREDLDKISQSYPIIVFSNDCHLLVCNSLALSLFKTVDILEDAKIKGILEDGPAMQAFDEITRYSDDYALKVARKAQFLLNEQGVTTVMDARADAVAFKAFQSLAQSNELTLRVLGAREIPAKAFATVEMIPDAIAETQAFMAEFSYKQTALQPTTTISHIKFFIDGVLQAPLHTALLRKPYHLDGIEQCGDCYYDKALLTELLSQTNQLGWHPHMHTVGDAGIDFALDCIEASQERSPNLAVRAGLAHNELTVPEHYSRFKQLNVIATQSLQWGAMSQITQVEFEQLLGKDRIEYFECAGRFYDAGIKVAYGSDWPIDHLNLWEHFQIGMNRQLIGDDYRHDNDRMLTIEEVLRSATIDAAYMLGLEHNIGSLEVSKFADFIVLDRDPFMLNSYEIHKVKVVDVFLGGKLINFS